MEKLTNLKLPTSGGVVARMSYLLRTGFQSDCSFLVGNNSNTEEFPAHRLILGTSSPVFKAMLYGPLAERGIVKVIDMTPEVFQVLLEFIYMDTAALLNLEHACGVLYAANKYILPELTKQCINYISVNLVPHSACAILELVRSLGVSELVFPCIKIICKNGDEVLSSNEVCNLTAASLVAILQCDDLQIEDETVAFAAAESWAHAQVNKNFMDTEDAVLPTEAMCGELRSVLANSGVLSQIRFLTMAPDQFLNGYASPARSGLLTTNEIRAILARIDPSSQDESGSPPALPVDLSSHTKPRIKLPTPVKRPSGVAVRRRTVKSSQLMRHVTGLSSFVMELSTTDDVTLTGLSFCTQIPGIEEYVRGRPSPPDVYTEELQIQVLSRRGDSAEVLGRTHFKGVLPYNGVATIALTNPVQLTRERGCSIMVSLTKAGDYPLSILSQREFHAGIGFRFEDFAAVQDNQKFAQDLGFIIGIVYSDA